MATTLKLRRGTTTQHASFTGAEGEVTIDTTKDTLVVHDGTTAGGFPLLKESAIGTTVQAYDADTTKNDVSNTFTQPQVFPAGTVSAPSLTTTGDTNTGIYFPAADTIAFTEGGVEAMRIDSSGNVGIGTSSPDAILTVSIASTSTTVGGSTAIAKIINSQSSALGETSGIEFFNRSATGSAKLAGVYGVYTDFNSTGYGGALAFATESTGSSNVTERMRIDSSGNVGIGTSSPGALLEINGGTVSTQLRLFQGSGFGYRIGRDTTDGLLWFYGEQSGANGYVFSGANGERMRITSGGNVGIGTSIPVEAIDILKTGGNAYLKTSDGTIITYYGTSNGGSAGLLGTLSNHPQVFWTNNTERMRIDSSGNLLVGTTSGTAQVNITSTSAKNVSNWRNFDDIGRGVACLNSSGTMVGSITWTASATTFATSSDYRLKENIAPMTGALAKVAALKPVTYTWKSTGEADEGFIAHELQEVCPSAVTGEKDAVDAEGNPVYQGIDTSFLVATLTAAIQELKAELDTVKAELQTLKGN